MARIEQHLPYGGGFNAPELIVIHACGEYIIDPQFDNEPMYAPDYIGAIGLSTHSIAMPDGANIRCRNDNKIAWHAKGFNTNSLGLEFAVAGEHTYGSFLEAIQHHYVTDAEYAAGLYQVKEWIDIYNIKKVVRHSDIDPSRKSDPGDGFPWQEFLADLRIG